jgi:hypothetical protein
MKTFRILLAAAAVLTLGAAPSFAQAGKCSGSYEQSQDYVAALVKVSAQAHAAAAVNPILEADVGYYAVELASAKLCLAQLKPAAVAAVR